MSHITIFPAMYREAEDQIIAYANDSSCLAFCQVSKLAQARLDNYFFKERFFANYPIYKAFEDKIFRTLRADHPNSYWKIACDFFCSHSLNASNPTMSIVFIQNHFRSIYQSRQLQISLYEFNIKETLEKIGCQDPNSDLHKIYQTFMECHAQKSMVKMTTESTNEAAALCEKKRMANPEEAKNLQLTIDQLILIADHADNFNHSREFIDLGSRYTSFSSDVCKPYQQKIEKDFKFALNMKDCLIVRAEFENCLKNIQAAVDKDCAASILEAIDTLSDSDIFDDFKEDDEAKEALESKEGRTEFLEEYKPILIDNMNRYLRKALAGAPPPRKS